MIPWYDYVIIYAIGAFLSLLITGTFTFGKEQASMTIFWPLWLLFLVIKLSWELIKLLVLTFKEFITLIK